MVEKKKASRASLLVVKPPPNSKRKRETPINCCEKENWGKRNPGPLSLKDRTECGASQTNLKRKS